jgi:hypothetical protein
MRCVTMMIRRARGTSGGPRHPLGRATPVRLARAPGRPERDASGSSGLVGGDQSAGWVVRCALRTTGSKFLTIGAAKVFRFYFMFAIFNYHCEMTTAPPPAARPRTRRLSDKLRLVFHAACDEAEFSVAEQRLNQLCKHTIRPSSHPTKPDRREPEDLSGVCERLANLLLWRSSEPVAPAVKGPLSRQWNT